MCTHPAAIFSSRVEASESGEPRNGTLALAKFVSPCGKRDLFVRISFRHNHLRNPCFVSRGDWHSADPFTASLSLPVAANGCAARSRRLDVLGRGRAARHRTDFHWHAESPET